MRGGICANGSAPATIQDRGVGNGRIPVRPLVAAAIDCRCKRTVVTTYLELLELGTSDAYAVHACITLYRIHHRQSTTNTARQQVTEWIGRGDGARGEALQTEKLR